MKKRMPSKRKTEVTTSAGSIQPEVPSAPMISEQLPRTTAVESRKAAEAAVAPAVSIRERIALLAYSYWEARGRQGGSSQDDWLRAEREVLRSPETAN